MTICYLHPHPPATPADLTRGVSIASTSAAPILDLDNKVIDISMLGELPEDMPGEWRTMAIETSESKLFIQPPPDSAAYAHYESHEKEAVWRGDRMEYPITPIIRLSIHKVKVLFVKVIFGLTRFETYVQAQMETGSILDGDSHMFGVTPKIKSIEQNTLWFVPPDSIDLQTRPTFKLTTKLRLIKENTYDTIDGVRLALADKMDRRLH